MWMDQTLTSSELMFRRIDATDEWRCDSGWGGGTKKAGAVATEHTTAAYPCILKHNILNPELNIQSRISNNRDRLAVTPAMICIIKEGV